MKGLVGRIDPAGQWDFNDSTTRPFFLFRFSKILPSGEAIFIKPYKNKPFCHGDDSTA